MRNNKLFSITSLTLLLCFGTNLPTLAVDNYNFSNTSENEFYVTNPANTAASGSQVIMPEEVAVENKPNAYPNYNNASSNAIALPHSTGSNSPSIALPDDNSSSYPEVWHGANSSNTYNITPIVELINADASIGTLQIGKIGLNLKVYNGDTFAAMQKGVGHIASTSTWNSNVGICGHNRGVNTNFERLNELKKGDIISYTTKLGARKYQVVFADKISATDWSKLQYTSDNRITLITCIANQPNYRLCVQAVEVK